MNLMPAAANWFELLVVRDDLATAMDVLAKSGHVELQDHGETSAPVPLLECRDLLEEYADLERRFEGYWPPAQAHDPDERAEPYAMLQDALRRLRAWAGAARDVVRRVEDLTCQRNDLLLLRDVFRSQEPMSELGQLSASGPLLQAALFLLPSGKWPEALPGGVIVKRVVTDRQRYLLALGLPEDIASLEHQLHMIKARRIELPKDLPGTTEQAANDIDARLGKVEEALRVTGRDLQALHEHHDIADAIADVGLVRWYADNVPDLEATEHFAWVTGWSSDTSEEPLLRLLADDGVRGMLHMSAPPAGYEPPMLLQNPRWTRPFEIFTSMLGVPSAGEADPTRILALISPLMFGYMFGDVGHGAVLVLAGLIFSRKLPALRLLVYGGAMSIVFGFLFGSVFALETVIPALWLHPIEDPLTILFVPLVGGAMLLLTGMCLDALQAYWTHKGLYWWETGAGLMLCYIALLGSVAEPRLLWLAVLGAAWFVVGHALVSPGRKLRSAATASGKLIESMLQLLVNTISFVRVGAFALAHTGLSLAVVGLSDATTSLTQKIIILVLGNALIIGLEGLVVSIQTTRLVLFEFFVRFMRAEGRPFRPLTPRMPLSPPEHRRPQ
jgi:V/A-type H+-transporting ATPase subunit I